MIRITSKYKIKTEFHVLEIYIKVYQNLSQENFRQAVAYRRKFMPGCKMGSFDKKM